MVFVLLVNALKEQCLTFVLSTILISTKFLLEFKTTITILISAKFLIKLKITMA